MRKTCTTFFVWFFVLIFISVQEKATAMPAYARAEGMDCSNCHNLSARPMADLVIEPNREKIGRTGSALDEPEDFEVVTSSVTRSAPAFDGRKLVTGSTLNISATKKDSVELSLDIFGNSDTLPFSDDPDVISATELDGASEVGISATLGGDIGSVNLGITAAISSVNGVQDKNSGLMFSTQGLSSGTKPVESSANGARFFDANQFSAGAKIGFFRLFGVSTEYKSFGGGIENGGGTNSSSIGAWVNLGENTSLESKFTKFKGDDAGFISENSIYSLMFISSF
jgi:hypothetical protein